MDNFLIDVKNLIPPQIDGDFCDNVQKKIFNDEHNAKKNFNIKHKIFLDVNHWHELQPKVIASFCIKDNNNNNKNELAKEKDLIKIKLGRWRNIFHDGGD